MLTFEALVLCLHCLLHTGACPSLELAKHIADSRGRQYWMLGQFHLKIVVTQLWNLCLTAVYPENELKRI